MCLCNPQDIRPYCGNKAKGCYPKPKPKKNGLIHPALRQYPPTPGPEPTDKEIEVAVQNVAKSMGVIPKPVDKPVEKKAPPSWEELELMYIQGDMTKAELLTPYGISATSGNSTSKTADWGKKRAEFKREVAEQARLEAIRKGVEALHKLDSGLFDLAPVLMPELARFIKAKKDAGHGMTPTEVQTVFNMILVRMDQPTSVSKNKIKPEDEDSDIDDYLRTVSAASGAITGNELGEPEPISYEAQGQ